jgi:hypothetical protein
MYNAYNYNDQESFIVKNSKRIHIHISKIIRDIQRKNEMVIPLFSHFDKQEDTDNLISDFFYKSQIFKPKKQKKKKRITAEIKIGS